MNSIIHNPKALIFSTLNAGVMSWKSGWLQFEQPSAQGDVSQLLEKAYLLIQSADSKEKALGIITAYENALKIEPKNPEALLGAGLYSFLIGYGYSDQKEEKIDFYSKAIKYFEQQMYLNKEFARLIDKSQKPWSAFAALSRNELDALFFYYLATGSLWKECLGGVGKIFNLHWGGRLKKMLKALLEIDPMWGGGTPYYAWAGYYASAPGFAGGDIKKAEEYYEKAIELGPEMLNFRRTRALFLHTRNKNRDAFKEDLQWVVAQNPNVVRHYFTYPWNIFVQRDAQYMLDHIDNYF